jgi:hypothetical protein
VNLSPVSFTLKTKRVPTFQTFHRFAPFQSFKPSDAQTMMLQIS